MMYDLFEFHLAPRVAALDYLVALGTHPIMNDEHLSKLVGAGRLRMDNAARATSSSPLGRSQQLCDPGHNPCR